MNKFTLLPLFLLLIFSLKAQDRIINLNQDTIECKIVSINSDRIMYDLKEMNGSVTSKFINLSQVAEFTRSAQSISNTKQANQQNAKLVNTPEHPWILGLKVGGSTMPWFLDHMPNTGEMREYYNKLRTGFHINTSAHYIFNRFIGVGAEYSFFNSRFDGSMQSPYSTSLYTVTSLKNQQYINFLGPSVLFQQHIGAKRKLMVREFASVGGLFFRMEEQTTTPNVNQSGYTDQTMNSLLTAKSLAAKVGLTVEYAVSPTISVGLGGNFTWGKFKKTTYEARGSNNHNLAEDTQELDKAIDLSRFDYSLVLHYQF